jgi:hypothetical protein
MIKGLIGDSTGSKWKKSWLEGFLLLIFLLFLVFLMLSLLNEWGDYFPIFRERKEDNPAQHLHEFHELMHQWGDTS